MFGLGVFQAVMIIVLSFRLRQIEELNKCGGRPSEELKQGIYKSQRRIKWLYGITCVLYVIFVTLLVILSFPVLDIIDKFSYYYIFVAQLSFVTVTLLVGFFYMIFQVNEIAIW